MSLRSAETIIQVNMKNKCYLKGTGLLAKGPASRYAAGP